MRKSFSTVAAALFAVITVSASAVPASAGAGSSFRIAGQELHQAGITSVGYHGGSNWRRHVRWCSARYKTYNRYTDTYFTGYRWKHCNSPYT